MNIDFTTERRAMIDAVHITNRHHEEHLIDKYHIRHDHPQSMKELREYFVNEWYVKPDEKTWERKEYEPFHCFEFRKHPADHDSYKKDMKARETDSDSVFLHIRVLEPEKALKHVTEHQKKYTVH